MPPHHPDEPLLAAVRGALVEVAAAGATVTYGELRSRLGPAEPPAGALAALLRQVSTEADAAGRGLLTAVVVRADTGRPGTGFFRLAAERGRDVADRRRCWEAELARVHAAFRPGAFGHADVRQVDVDVPGRPEAAGPPLVVDAHAHAAGFLPPVVRAAHRLAHRRTVPPDADLAEIAGHVDAAVVCAVGDRVVARLARGRDPVGAQLAHAVRQADAAGAEVVAGAAGVGPGRPAVLLGVEGADVAGDDLGTFDRWAALGVVVVGPVHLGDNQFGTTAIPWQRYGRRVPMGRRRADAGLTPLGRRAVAHLQDLGVLVDLAHADRATLLAAVEAARAPVAVTHGGARAVRDFPRFLADDELRAVAGTGGVVGLWPFRQGELGVRDVAELVAHASHVADLVGPQHLCIGTDTNGVPGLPEGYRGPADLAVVAAALRRAGFGDDDLAGVLGRNLLRVLAAAADGAAR